PPSQSSSGRAPAGGYSISTDSTASPPGRRNRNLWGQPAAPATWPWRRLPALVAAEDQPGPGEPLGQPGPQRPGQVGHGPGVGLAAPVQPVGELAGPGGRVAGPRDAGPHQPRGEAV